MERLVRTLIADDRRVTYKDVRTLLSLYPQVEEVGEAGYGQEAMRFVPECLPDVVLMDMLMPVMDGLEATRRIKEQWPEVRVIALTMYTKHRSEAIAAGTDAFLLKDGRPDALLGAILAQVHSPSAQSAAPLEMTS